MFRHTYNSRRKGGIYVVVLGTSMIVAVLGLAALVGQRLQNRMLTASADMRQAQLNAHAAVELALLTTRENNNWRSQLDVDSHLFKNKNIGPGSLCSLKVTDALADPATAAADRPFTLLGIGSHGPTAGSAPRTAAAQRVEATVDPHRSPHDCLKQAGSAPSAAAWWQAIFDYYAGPPTSANGSGTQIAIGSLPDRTPNFGRNPSLDDGQTYWTGNIPDGIAGCRDADGTDVVPFAGHTACFLVQRNDWRECGANRLNVAFLKPDTSYDVSLNINPAFILPIQVTKFRISLIAEFADGSTALSPNKIVQTLRGDLILSNWTNPPISGTLRTPNWSQHPIAVYLVVNSDDPSGSHNNFYIDNLDFYESGARFIYQTALGPGVNPYGTQATNQKGLYWIDCQSATKLVIERSRIFGTLLVLNPGPGSRIAYGPLNWSPAMPGYPTLLVNGDFTIQGTLATDPRLRELDNAVNYNPAGAPHRDFGTDNWTDGVAASEVNDYETQIRGLVGISGNLTYQYSPLMRAKVVVGGTVTGTPTLDFQPDSLLNPPPPLGVFYTYRYDRRPASTRKAVLP
jgi:hypothetical protein